MLMRRFAIDAIGAFDPAFGAGYGEENDFCLRAARAGFRNVLADDAFVVHTGGRSFGERRAALGAQNLTLIAQRFPHYASMVRDYVAADPVRPLRDAAQLWIDRHDARPHASCTSSTIAEAAPRRMCARSSKARAGMATLPGHRGGRSLAGGVAR